jgi:hypothetical protein
MNGPYQGKLQTTNLESVQLDVGIAMRQPFDHTGHCIFAAVLLRCNFIADIHNILPVL